MSVFKVSVLITLAGKRVRMTNGLIYVCFSIGCVLFIGGWAIYLAIELDKARAVIKEQRLKMLRMFEPPF